MGLSQDATQLSKFGGRTLVPCTDHTHTLKYVAEKRLATIEGGDITATDCRLFDSFQRIPIIAPRLNRADWRCIHGYRLLSHELA
jgi:hypothetical protein